MPQPLSYHAFADCRTFFGVANFFNVVSNLPFLIGGALGLRLIWSGGGRFIDAREQLPYLVFFLGALLTCFGSAYYHAAPDNPRLVWDRLPMTLGFAGLVAAADRRARGSEARPAVAVAAAAARRGHRHLLVRHRTRGRRQSHPVRAPTRPGPSSSSCCCCSPIRRGATATAGCWRWAAVWYGLAKVFETFDLQVYRLLGGTLSGHTIKHVLASFAVFAIVRQLRVRA